MAMTESAPMLAAWRANSTATSVDPPATPMTVGIRPSTVLTMTSATVRRSSSESVQNSEALTGATTPCAPASTQKATSLRRLSRSSAPVSVNGVQGMVKMPRQGLLTEVSSVLNSAKDEWCSGGDYNLAKEGESVDR